MKVNTKVRYGLRAVVEIARHHETGGILQKDIAAKQNISFKYLDHIVNALKVADIIRRKDIKSGFTLSREPKQISVYDIYRAFEPEVLIVTCLDAHINCTHDDSCVVKGFWCEMNNMITEKFKSVTVEDFMKKNSGLINLTLPIVD